MADEVGGTKIQRRQPVAPQQQPQQQQMSQMGQVNPQQMTPEQQQYIQQQQQMAYQQQQQQMAYQQQQQQQINRQSIPPQVVGGELVEQNIPNNIKVNRQVEVKSKPLTGIKSKFGESSEGNSNFKETLIVVLLFVVLNSKLVWKQLMKLPFMGSVEPSIIALIVNSLLAGIVYFIIKKFLLPK